MTGQTADISAICEFEWFQWIMYYEPTESYPNDRMTIGRYLGPALDVGTALTHKILKSNGQVLARNTVRAWTPDEESNPSLIQARKDYMVSMEATMGPACTEDDFEVEDVTPVYEAYADQDEDGLEGTPDDDLPPTPEAGDNYVGARLLLPRGADVETALGKVVKRARDNSGTLLGGPMTALF